MVLVRLFQVCGLVFCLFLVSISITILFDFIVLGFSVVLTKFFWLVLILVLGLILLLIFSLVLIFILVLILILILILL